MATPSSSRKIERSATPAGRFARLRSTWARLLCLTALIAAVGPAASGAAAGDPPGARRTPAIDWNQVGEEAARLLARYVQIDTTNPPGNEAPAARFLAGVLEAAGLSSEVAESAPGRANVYARRPGRGNGALVLLSHMDVVPADPAEWAVPPFSGSRREDFIYGRGTLDSKGIGIAQLMALILIERHGVSLDHDVVFLATADEETGGRLGAGWVIRERPDWIRGASMVLNEGDHIHTGGERPVAQIAVAEKSPCWLRLTARGPAGHGSTPPAETAVTRLLTALDRVRAHRPPLRIIPAVAAYFSAVAPLRDRPHRERLRDLSTALADPAYRAEFEADPSQYALVHNTITPTVLEGSQTTNVIPSKASADLDCRLLPGEDLDAFVDDLERVIDDPGIEVARLLAFESPPSPVESPLMSAIRAVATRELDDPLVLPSVITGFTDSHYFRGLGILSYGFAPFAQPPGERRRIHGNDERVSVRVLRDAVRFMYQLLLEIG